MKIQITLAALAVTLALAGCVGQTPVTSGGPAPSTVGAPPVVSATPTPTKAKTWVLGDTVTWDGGVAVTLSKPVAFTPSEYAAGGKQAQNVLLTVTLVNGSTDPFDPSLFSITASSAGVEATQVFDSGQGIGGSPETQILPGKTVTWKVGLNLADANDITAEVSPDFAHKSALFTSK